MDTTEDQAAIDAAQLALDAAKAKLEEDEAAAIAADTVPFAPVADQPSTTDGSAMDAAESAVESFVATLEGEAHGVANAALNSMKSAHATIKALIASL